LYRSRRRETVDGRMRSVPVRPCLCHGTQLCTARIFGYVQIMLDKVVEFWLLRAAPAGRRRNEAASATSQYRVLQIGLLSRRWRHACSAGARTLRRACRRDRDAAGRGERRARRFMGYAGPSSGTEERLIIANAVDCMRTLRARACTRQRPEGTPRPTLQPLFAAPPLHSCSSLERSLPACPCAADDAIVIDCMVKGVIPPDCKSER